jgi:hypothetical protein
MHPHQQAGKKAPHRYLLRRFDGAKNPLKFRSA